jgi:NADH-quinone oxidoreductase subunit J
MIQAYGLYIASTIGAVALFLMMPRQGYNPRPFGALLGAAALGGLWLSLGGPLIAQMDQSELGFASSALPYYYIFSGLAVLAAVRVITHTQPVYSALWFVMVVLSSSGLFLILGAEFVAFGMVIIYGGAILVTYMFVIMLASQSAETEATASTNSNDAGTSGSAGTETGSTSTAINDNSPHTATEYDRVARQPAGAVIAGFLLLALLLDVSFRQMSPNSDAAGPTAKELIHGVEATENTPAAPAILSNRTQKHLLENASESDRAAMEATGISDHQVDNAERIGVDLFQGHPLGLELAGVILLISLVGAIVIAKQRSGTDSGTSSKQTNPTS